MVYVLDWRNLPETKKLFHPLNLTFNRTLLHNIITQICTQNIAVNLTLEVASAN